MTLTIVTPKYYENVFSISHSTAVSWYNDDLCMIGRKRMTIVQFDFIYKGIDKLAVPEAFKPIKKAAKVQNSMK